MPAAARMNDKVLQDGPHCHAPMHPPGSPAPAPLPHPPQPWTITLACIPTVIIEGQQAAVVGSTTDPCKLATCVPNGPGIVAKGSATVKHCGLPAARVGDASTHPGCIAPVPMPTGKVIPPGATKVIIGG